MYVQELRMYKCRLHVRLLYNQRKNKIGEELIFALGYLGVTGSSQDPRFANWSFLGRKSPEHKCVGRDLKP